MVAQTVKLPNIRKLFIPDEGCVIYDADLERADAQVVAWEADDDELKQIFREGLDIHMENAKAVYHTNKPTYIQRHNAKSGIHGINYGVKARTLARTLKCTVAEADDFINRWFGAHPKIAKWHKRVRREVNQTRSISNKFGYRMYFFDRLETVLPKALAWVPQSTVALVTNKGLVKIFKHLPDIQLLLQVHDSLVMQGPADKVQEHAPQIIEQMSITVPYDDPLIIPVNLSISNVSWGDCKKAVELNDNFYWEDEYKKDGTTNLVKFN